MCLGGRRADRDRTLQQRNRTAGLAQPQGDDAGEQKGLWLIGLERQHFSEAGEGLVEAASLLVGHGAEQERDEGGV